LELIIIILITFFFIYDKLDLLFDFNDFIDRFFLEAEDNERVKEVLGLEKKNLKIISEFVKVCGTVLYYLSFMSLVAYFFSCFG